MKKALKWGAVIFAAWLIVQQPVQAAHLMHGAGYLLDKAATGFSAFIKGM